MSTPPSRGSGSQNEAYSGPDHLSAFVNNIGKHVDREIKARKRRRHEHKTTCAQCGKKAEKGVKLSMCSRCKAVNYCSAVCQKAHYNNGHKLDCLNFVDPPFAKSFNPSDRPDVPWPVDPIIGAAHEKGVGVWITTDSDLSMDLDQAFQPPDRRVRAGITGTPSFRRWAGVEGPNRRPASIDAKKYLSMTPFAIRMVIHNRSKDQVVGLYLENQPLLVHPTFDQILLPEQKAKSERTKIGEHEMLVVEPWKDYNQQTRFAILEINGVTAPVGTFEPKETGEYKPPTPPTGAPWDRVMNWRKGHLALGPGDYTVVALQYRLGDGHNITAHPEIVQNSFGLHFRAMTLDTKGTEPDWPKLAEKEWNDPKRMIERALNPIRRMIATYVLWDYEYIKEYYKPYFGEGPHVFMEQRLGARAKQANDVSNQVGHMGFKALLASMKNMPPEKRAALEQQMANMGYSVEAMEQLVKGSTPQ